MTHETFIIAAYAFSFAAIAAITLRSLITHRKSNPHSS